MPQPWELLDTHLQSHVYSEQPSWSCATDNRGSAARGQCPREKTEPRAILVIPLWEPARESDRAFHYQRDSSTELISGAHGTHKTQERPAAKTRMPRAAARSGRTQRTPTLMTEVQEQTLTHTPPDAIVQGLVFGKQQRRPLECPHPVWAFRGLISGPALDLSFLLMHLGGSQGKDGTQGSWCQPGSIPTAASIFGEQICRWKISLCLSQSLSVCLKKKKN